LVSCQHASINLRFQKAQQLTVSNAFPFPTPSQPRISFEHAIFKCFFEFRISSTFLMHFFFHLNFIKLLILFLIFPSSVFIIVPECFTHLFPSHYVYFYFFHLQLFVTSYTFPCYEYAISTSKMSTHIPILFSFLCSLNFFC
jgi:hypothetical protein